MTIRVLLADDQALLRATFRILIDSVADMTVVAEAADGREAVDLTATHRPDVVIMDIRMPDVDGVTATAAICARPELSGTH
ncbi:response regulator, partial [Streptomyces sp. NPDC002920]